MEDATREIYWNVRSFVPLMYAMAVVSTIAFVYGFYQRIRPVLIGRTSSSIDRWPERLRGVYLWERRFFRRKLAGTMHFAMLWGTLILFLGTVVVFLHEDLRLHIMTGGFYLVFESLILDVVGFLATLGILTALVQRYVLRVNRLSNGTVVDGLLLVLLLALLVSGFLVQGLRLVATADPWAIWSPIGMLAGALIGLLAPTYEAQVLAHKGLWILHAILAFTTIGILPYTKLGHLILAPVNVFLRPLDASGIPSRIDFEQESTLGVARISEFTRKQLLDLEACTACGRCEERCPASQTHKALSPRRLIQDLRTELRDQRLKPAADKQDPLVPRAVGEVIWCCTTCLACQEECPAHIEPVPKIVDLRRYQVMEVGEFPEKLQEMSTCLDKRGHPFPGLTISRRQWSDGLQGLDSHLAANGASLLYWVGCAAALNERTMKIAAAFYQILERAGIEFRMLGANEPCCGDPARRIGNEYQYEAIVKQNLEMFSRAGIMSIVTPCPHCFSAFKNDYAQFGGRLNVLHHSQMIADLARSWRISLRGMGDKKVTYHDPCYLGRYNGLYQPVRSLLRGFEFREMAHAASSSLCCGGGGGRFWVDEPPEHRVSYLRMEQVLSTGARSLVTACPFCMLMLDEAAKSRVNGQVETIDVAELVLAALDPSYSVQTATTKEAPVKS
ncbi:MAG: (Fe-S)-binding protein [Chloroflexota bacterium]|nr:MAG: (Fe-S)-binding protein [Chloroflexota bacterium]